MCESYLGRDQEPLEHGHPPPPPLQPEDQLGGGHHHRLARLRQRRHVEEERRPRGSPVLRVPPPPPSLGKNCGQQSGRGEVLLEVLLQVPGVPVSGLGGSLGST